MAIELPNQQQLLLEIKRLRNEVDRLTQEKADLEIMLEMTTHHSDLIETELQNQADETVRTSEKKLAQFLEAMPVGVSILDAQGKPYYFNQRAQQLLGTAIMPEFTLFDKVYLTGTHQPYPSEKLPSVQALKGQSTNVDNMEIYQGEQTIPLEVWGTPVFDETGCVTYAIIAFQDITERKQAEAEHIRFIKEREAKEVAQRLNKEIDRKNQELIKLDQEKNEFVGIVAHDLKNPLSAIKGYTEEIQEYFDNMSKTEVLELIGLLQTSSQRMFDLITNLLDMNAIESGKMNLSLSKVDILNSIISVVNDYTPRAKDKGITFQLDYVKTQYIALVDNNITHQILDNLISNAVKYSPQDKNIYVHLSLGENTVRCEIQDEGPGLSKEDQDHLFGKFKRLTPQPTGKEHSTGLGLFIVKKLVEMVKGKVWCESQLGQGAAFIVELPMAHK